MDRTKSAGGCVRPALPMYAATSCLRTSCSAGSHNWYYTVPAADETRSLS